jgi:hypothetical protein
MLTELSVVEQRYLAVREALGRRSWREHPRTRGTRSGPVLICRRHFLEPSGLKAYRM